MSDNDLFCPHHRSSLLALRKLQSHPLMPATNGARVWTFWGTSVYLVSGVWDDRDRELSPWAFYWADGSAVDSCWLNKGTCVRTSALVTII